MKPTVRTSSRGVSSGLDPPAPAAARLRITSVICSLYGRAAATRAWALTIRLAAMSSIAFVIFFVLCTDLIRRRRMRSAPPAMDLLRCRFRRDEPLLEALDGGLQLVLGQAATGGEALHHRAVAAADVLDELGLEAADVGDRDVVQVAVGAGVDGDDLIGHAHRAAVRLLEQLDQAAAAV